MSLLQTKAYDWTKGRKIFCELVEHSLVESSTLCCKSMDVIGEEPSTEVFIPMPFKFVSIYASCVRAAGTELFLVLSCGHVMSPAEDDVFIVSFNYLDGSGFARLGSSTDDTWPLCMVPRFITQMSVGSDTLCLVWRISNFHGGGYASWVSEAGFASTSISRWRTTGVPSWEVTADNIPAFILCDDVIKMVVTSKDRVVVFSRRAAALEHITNLKPLCVFSFGTLPQGSCPAFINDIDEDATYGQVVHTYCEGVASEIVVTAASKVVVSQYEVPRLADDAPPSSALGLRPHQHHFSGLVQRKDSLQFVQARPTLRRAWIEACLFADSE